MSISIDKVLGFHPAALLLRENRSTILASNIANADTPGYKAKDLDFRQALQAVLSSDSQSLANDPSGNDFVKYRVPFQPDTGDGNSVDMQHEKMAFAQNALQYQMSLKIVDGRFKGLMKAIKGE